MRDKKMTEKYSLITCFDTRKDGQDFTFYSFPFFVILFAQIFFGFSKNNHTLL